MKQSIKIKKIYFQPFANKCDIINVHETRDMHAIMMNGETVEVMKVTCDLHRM